MLNNSDQRGRKKIKQGINIKLQHTLFWKDEKRKREERKNLKKKNMKIYYILGF